MGVSENQGYLRVPLKGYYKGSFKGFSNGLGSDNVGT